MTRRKGEHWYLPLLTEQLAERRIGRREFVRQASLLGLGASAAYALAGKVTGSGALPSARAQGNMPRGGTIRISSRCYDVENAHALKLVEASNVSRQVFDYLTETGVDNVTRPSLCERWDPSPDLKSWTLHLRRDVKFANGRPLVADDVIWNLNRVLEPKTGSSMLGLMKPYLLEEYETAEVDDAGKKKKSTRLWDANAIEKVDDHTVRLNGKSAQLAVPEYLFHYPLVIMDPAEGGLFKPGANGTGAFELVEAQVGERHVMRARKQYWGEGPYLDGFELVDFGDDQAAQLLSLASRQVEGVHQGDPSMVGAFKAISHAKLYTVVTSSTGIARMRPTEKPFDDVRVRQAFRYATDCKAILDTVVKGLGAVGEHIHCGPMHPDYAQMPAFPYDVEKARRLLAEAGYPNGIDVEIWVKNVPWELATVETLVEQWRLAALRVTIKPVPSKLYWENWLTLPFGLTTWAHRPLGVMLFALAYRTGVAWNESGWSHAEFDRLLADAERTLDSTRRKSIMDRLQQIMQEEGPLVLPMWKSNVTFMDERVLGYKYHPTNYIFAERLALRA